MSTVWNKLPYKLHYNIVILNHWPPSGKLLKLICLTPTFVSFIFAILLFCLLSTVLFFSRRWSEHTDRNVKLKPTVLFRTPQLIRDSLHSVTANLSISLCYSFVLIIIIYILFVWYCIVLYLYISKHTLKKVNFKLRSINLRQILLYGSHFYSKQGLHFAGALRFYFEDGGNKLAKAIWLSSQTTVDELMPRFRDKFNLLENGRWRTNIYQVHNLGKYL